MSSWVLLPNLSVVSDAATGPLGDPVQVGKATGIVIGRGNPGATVPSVEEGRQLANNALAKARALGTKDPNAEHHFERHAEKLWRALGRASGQRPDFDTFIAELRKLVSSGSLQLVAAVVIAKTADAPTVEYKFQGQVGSSALTMLMKPNGDWHTLWRTGEGDDLSLVVALQMLEGSLLPPKVVADTALARALELIRALERDIWREKGLHESLLKGSTTNPLQAAAFYASLLNPLTAAGALVNPANRNLIGAGVNLLNPAKRPPLSIWKRAEDFVAAAKIAWAMRNTEQVVTAATIGRAHYLKADGQLTAWRDGIEVAGRKAELAIAAAAIVAAAVAVALYASQAAAAAAASGTAATAGTQTGTRVANTIADSIVRIATAETVAQEQAAEQVITEEVPKMMARSLGR